MLRKKTENMHYSLTWLLDKVDRSEPLEYIFFWGHSSNGASIGKFIFSQWFSSPFQVDGVLYKTSEHWMMARKAALFNDAAILSRILAADKPGEVKALGREIRDFDEQVWIDCRYQIVVEGNYHKFRQNPGLGEYLVGTNTKILVEASPQDTIWGVGLSQDSKEAANPHAWKGLNLLGFALMEVRDRLSIR